MALLRSLLVLLAAVGLGVLFAGRGADELGVQVPPMLEQLLRNVAVMTGQVVAYDTPLSDADRLEYGKVVPAKVVEAVAGSLPRLAGSGDESRRSRRVAVGYNTNVDLVVPFVNVAQTLLGKTPNAPVRPLDHPQPSTVYELRETMSYFLQRGAAAERKIGDAKLWKRLLDAAESVPDGQRAPGGNAALMANRFADLGCQVLLGGCVGDALLPLLHRNLTIASPDGVDDEVHLILEYLKGAVWSGLRAPRSNRLILVRDLANAELRALSVFHQAARDFKPDLMVLSGLHLIEGNSNERGARVGRVVDAMADVPLSTLTHFELASIADPMLLSDVAVRVAPYVDSLGFNEQEMAALLEVLTGMPPPVLRHGPVTHGNIAHTVDSLLRLASYYRRASAVTADGVTASPRRLSRLHFHTLQFHVLVTWSDAPDTRKRWGNDLASASAGSVQASRQACNVSASMGLDEVWNEFYLAVPAQHNGHTMPSLPAWDLQRNGAVTWQRDDVVLTFVPVMVCKHPVRTVGLGDSISASGLLAHLPSAAA